jgi:hypothetical protein
MEEKKQKKLYPGDEGYKGGVFTSTVFIDGKAKEVRTVKDENGNVTYMSITNKILGIF